MQPFVKEKKKIALVGFASTTRNKAPWNDPEYEIWIMNEEAHFDWCPRYDRSFQMHPRWNFINPQNPNDPNHLYWLQNKEGLCRRCGGTKKFKVGDKVMDCMECNDKGIYPVDSRRKDTIVYMQKAYADIPGSTRFPLKELSRALNTQMDYEYFSSTPAFALALAIGMGYEVIETYGIEMANDTEYNFQRPNMEYWIGLGRGMGRKINIVSEAGGLLHSELYGYASLKIGYRQDVEARQKMLENQIITAQTNMDRWYGRVQMLQEVMKWFPELDIKERFVQTEEQYRTYVGTLNFVNGAKREAKNLCDLYDAHFMNEVLERDEDAKK